MNTNVASSRASQQLTIAQMATFLAAAGSESFSDAARSLAISQPSLSRSIREVEEALGVTLFQRSHNGIALSRDGRAFMLSAKHLLGVHAQAQAAMSSWCASRRGQLRVVGSITVMSVVLPTLMQALRSEFGLARMCVQTCPSTEVVQQVLEGKTMLGVATDADESPLLRCTPVLSAPLGVLAAPGCPLPAHIESLADLANVPMVRLAEQNSVTRMLRREGIAFPAYFDAPVSVSSVPAALELMRVECMATVASGIGASHSQAAGMRFIPLPLLLPTASAYVLSRRDVQFNEQHEVMRDILRTSIYDTSWHPSVRPVGRIATGQQRAHA